MRYRPQRGSLADSMAEVIEVRDRAELLAILRGQWKAVGVEITDDQMKAAPYGGDDSRIGWLDVHIVTIDGLGVQGFCEGPLP